VHLGLGTINAPHAVSLRLASHFVGVGESTGLGMAISFGIIEEHNGSIEVESTEDEGTVICVRFPLNDYSNSPADISATADYIPNYRALTFFCAHA
jgi:hypothetical protein